MKRARVAEIAVALVVIAVVAMLIVPLPRPLLDGLLVTNIGAAVALLMAAVFTPSPLGFVSFPTLLVITTLFRVGLEVSMTRLVLADANAGEVVRAFGTTVVAGNLIVGLVVFAVITIVQLIVVARGAERVAEVAARFALDAMPGKQMAIDAEVRTGAVDPEGARKRRADLERESQLYGAMDGAMRFVKGDAIAAIVIVVINLVGGLAIGIGSRGMSAAEAVRTYSLLSIGAGLVAVASGLLVTRVASAGDRAFGEDLGAQLLGSPRALAGAAVLLVGLALVPALPAIPFLALGVVAAAGAYLAARARPTEPARLDEPGADRVHGPRLTLLISEKTHREQVRDPAALHDEIATERAEVTKRTGIPIPPLAVAIDASLAENEAALAIDGTPAAYYKIKSHGDVAVDMPLAQLVPELIGIDRVAQLVERTAAHSPVLVREVVPRMIALPALAELLRSLAREQVPLDELAPILEAVATATTKDPIALGEHVRAHLRRAITARWAPRGQLAVYTVDAMIEDSIRTSIDRREGAAVLALEPAIAHDIVAAVRGKLGDKGVLLVSSDIRRHLRGLLEPELPDIAILAAHELAPGTAVTTVGRIDV